MSTKLAVVLLVVLLCETTDARCYFCDSSSGGSSGDVSNPSLCTTITTCQPDEICGVEDAVLGGQSVHRYGCKNARICTLLMQMALQDMDRCNKDPILCGNVKRSAGMTVCTACCGDDLCNKGTCKDVMNNLYKLYANGTLDMHTLTATTAGTIVG